MSDRFTTDVLREAFYAVTDEMFESLKRTSQSPVIYEVLDFAVGLTDAGGELVSQATGSRGFSARSERPRATRSYGFPISRRATSSRRTIPTRGAVDTSPTSR